MKLVAPLCAQIVREPRPTKEPALTPLYPLSMFIHYERASPTRFRFGLSLGSINRGLSDRGRDKRGWPRAQHLGCFLPTTRQNIERGYRSGGLRPLSSVPRGYRAHEGAGAGCVPLLSLLAADLSNR